MIYRRSVAPSDFQYIWFINYDIQEERSSFWFKCIWFVIYGIQEKRCFLIWKICTGGAKLLLFRDLYTRRVLNSNVYTGEVMVLLNWNVLTVGAKLLQNWYIDIGEVKVLLNWNVYAGEAPTNLEYCTEGANWISIYVYMVPSSDVKCLYRRSEAPFTVC